VTGCFKIRGRGPVDQVILPSPRSPLDIAPDPLDVIGPNNLLALGGVDDERVMLVELAHRGLLAGRQASILAASRVPLAAVRVFDRVGIHVETDNVVSVRLLSIVALHGMVKNLEPKVVVEHVLIRLGCLVLELAAKGEPEVVDLDGVLFAISDE
jgi:hypothetical protein